MTAPPAVCPACGAVPEDGSCSRCRRVAAASERRLATVLFVDLTGYTELHRRLDPEEVELRVRPVLRRLRGVVHEHGGAVPSVAGDGFLAVFGVVRAHEDDALRAVTAAVRCVATAADSGLTVHCGAATGEVLVGPNEEGLSGWAASGAVVNLASRLSDAASAGQVLVDEHCAALAGDAVRWTACPPVPAKGFPEPVATRLAAGLQATREPAAQTGFVNRGRELAELDAALAQAAAGPAAVARLVLAEAGGGASRLVAHWAGQHPEARLLRGRCRAYGEDLPLQALLEAAGPLVDSDADLEDGGAGDLRARLTGLAVELTRPADPGSGAEGRTQEVLRLLARALRAASRTATVLLVVEDLHAASPGLLEVLEALPGEVGAAPVVVLGTARDGELPTDLGWVSVRLPPLTDGPVTELVTGLLDAPPDEAVLQVLTTRAGGNPLLLQECVALVRDRQALRVHEGRTTLVAPGALDALPRSVSAWIGARLDALPDDERRLLQEASTCGDEVEPAWLAAMLDTDPGPVLGRLVERGLLVRERPDEPTLRFRSVLVREVAGSRLPKAVRRVRHAQLMQLVPAQARPALHALHALAAHELTPVGAPERTERAAAAVQALAHAAEVAFAVQARAADELVERALPLLAELPDLSPAASALLELAARVRIETGRPEEAVTLARRAARAGVDVGDRARARVTEGLALDRAGDVTSARVAALDVLATLPPDAPGTALLRGRALAVQGATHRYEDMGRYVAGLEQAHAVLTQAAEPRAALEAGRVAVELAYLLTLEAGEAHDRWWQEAERATSAEDLRGRASLARSRSIVLLARGEVEQARQTAASALRDGDEIGARHVCVDALLVLVEACSATGEHRRVRELRERLLAEAAAGSPRLRFAVAASCALPLLRQDGPAVADGELATAASLSEGLGDGERLSLAVAQAWTALDRGDPVAALAACYRVSALAQGLGWRASTLLDDVCRARAGLLTGTPGVDWDRALSLSDELRAAPYAAQLRLLRRQHAWAAGQAPEGPAPSGHRTPELRALQAEDAALAARHRGDEQAARTHWHAAARAWSELGRTVWLARALRHAGDRGQAQQVLAWLQAPEGTLALLERGAQPAAAVRAEGSNR